MIPSDPGFLLFDAVVKYCKGKVKKEDLKSFNNDLEQQSGEPLKVFGVKAKPISSDGKKSDNKDGKGEGLQGGRVFEIGQTSARISTPVPSAPGASAIQSVIEGFEARARELQGAPVVKKSGNDEVKVQKNWNNIKKIESKDIRVETLEDNSVIGQKSGKKSSEPGLVGSNLASDPSRDQSKLELSNVDSSPNTLTQLKESNVTNFLSDKIRVGQLSTVGEKSHNSGRQENANRTVVPAVGDQKAEGSGMNQKIVSENILRSTGIQDVNSQQRVELKNSFNPNNSFNNSNTPVKGPASTVPPLTGDNSNTYPIITGESLWDGLRGLMGTVEDLQTPAIMAILVYLDSDAKMFVKEVLNQFFERHHTLQYNWEQVLVFSQLTESSMSEMQRYSLQLQVMRNPVGEPVESFFVFAAAVIQQMALKRVYIPAKSMYAQAYMDFIKRYYGGHVDMDTFDTADFMSFTDLLKLLSVMEVVDSIKRGSITSPTGKLAGKEGPNLQNNQVQSSVPIKTKVVAEHKGSKKAGLKQADLSKFFSSPIKEGREGHGGNAPIKSGINLVATVTKGQPQSLNEKKVNYPWSGAQYSGGAKGDANERINEFNNSNKDNSNKDNKNNNNNKKGSSIVNNMNQNNSSYAGKLYESAKVIAGPGKGVGIPIDIYSSYETAFDGTESHPTVWYAGNIRTTDGKLINGSFMLNFTKKNSEEESEPQTNEEGYYWGSHNEPIVHYNLCYNQ